MCILNSLLLSSVVIFLAGSTDTSLWTHYKAGERSYCGNKLPEDMRKNDKLEGAIITPTTKAADHDVPISPQEILDQGILSQQDWHQVSAQHLIDRVAHSFRLYPCVVWDKNVKLWPNTSGIMLLTDSVC